MPTARNPILPGFHPDPSLCRVGGDYYLATSTFEWWPGVRIHHSRDLVHWRLAARPLAATSQLDLRGNPDSGGIWAPCLSHAHGCFWLVYTDVKHHSGAFKDTHNYVVTAERIEGPWSAPVYLSSPGFDPSFFHDDDGRTWMVCMRWDHRPGRNRSNGILLQEFDRAAGRLVGEPKMIFAGTALGCTEGPHLYRRDGWYWLLVAEGGTGSHHAVTVARSRTIDGPYEPDPSGPMLTSRDAWHLPLQKAGHASLVDTPAGDWFAAHLCGRPDRPLGRCLLGRETALQRVAWPAGSWPRLAQGGNRPAETVEVPLAAHPWPAEPAHLAFDGPVLPACFDSLRDPIDPSWCSLTERPGWLRLRGRESPHSRFRQSLIARRIQHHACTVECEIDAEPVDFQQMAGLMAFYDCDLWFYARITHDEVLGRVVGLAWSEHGGCGEGTPMAIPQGRPVRLHFTIADGILRFAAAVGDGPWRDLGEGIDAGRLSDENHGPGGWNFTGSWAALAAHDLSGRRMPADVAWFAYRPGGSTGA
jgi:xylan 1,4-beta-xylosidase